MSIVRALALFLLAALSVPAHARNHALLMGVAAYDDSSIRPLQGPRNDVILMWRHLLSRGFARDDIRVLAEGLPTRADIPVPKAPPTRTEILAGFAHLADVAAPGDFVVIHFSGHGSTQPERDPANNPDPEPDGRDQVLLPKDAGTWDAAAGTIRNAIVDDEVGAALDRIRAKGATVWAIFDACHAGTVTRSTGGAVTRAVDPVALGVPEAAPPPRAPAIADRARLLKPLSKSGDLIGFYAVDARTEAIEREFLVKGDGFVGNRFGVFTWHLMRALESGRARTHLELARQISLDMASGGAGAPLPVFDGHLDRGLFGATSAAPRRFAARREGEEIVFDAGGLHGVDAGAVVALHDGPLPDARKLASVSILAADAVGSRAVAPAGLAEPASGLWASVETPGVEFRYRVAAEDAETRAMIAGALADVEGARGLAIDIVEEGPRDLLVSRYAGALWFTPDGETPDRDPLSHLRGVSLRVPGPQRALRESLFAFARAANLVRLASVAETAGADGEDVRITLQRIRETDPARLADSRRDCGAMTRPSPAESVTSGAPAALSHCDEIRLAIANDGPRDLDVGVFFLDRAGAIDTPNDGRDDWAKRAGCVASLPARAESPIALRTPIVMWGPSGPELAGQARVLVFALPRREGVPTNLCHLLQPGVEALRTTEIALRNPGRKGFAALLDRAALLDPALRAVPPPTEPDENAGVAVRQFVLDIRAPRRETARP